MEQLDWRLRKSLNITETRRVTGWGRKFLYELLKSGKLRGIRNGKKWYIPVSAIDEYMQRAAGQGVIGSD